MELVEALQGRAPCDTPRRLQSRDHYRETKRLFIKHSFPAASPGRKPPKKDTSPQEADFTAPLGGDGSPQEAGPHNPPTGGRQSPRGGTSQPHHKARRNENRPQREFVLLHTAPYYRRLTTYHLLRQNPTHPKAGRGGGWPPKTTPGDPRG